MLVTDSVVFAPVATLTADLESEVEESEDSGSEFEASSSSEDIRASDEEGGSDEDLEAIPVELVRIRVFLKPFIAVAYFALLLDYTRK